MMLSLFASAHLSHSMPMLRAVESCGAARERYQLPPHKGEGHGQGDASMQSSLHEAGSEVTGMSSVGCLEIMHTDLPVQLAGCSCHTSNKLVAKQAPRACMQCLAIQPRKYNHTVAMTFEYNLRSTSTITKVPNANYVLHTHMSTMLLRPVSCLMASPGTCHSEASLGPELEALKLRRQVLTRAQ